MKTRKDEILIAQFHRDIEGFKPEWKFWKMNTSYRIRHDENFTYIFEVKP